MTDIVCPRERTYMTPCIARDGALALDDGDDSSLARCVGCDITPRRALEGLAKHYPPAKAALQSHTKRGLTPAQVADRLTELVRAHVESK